MTEIFELHPKLAADTYPLDDTPHCRVLLMNDSRFPWVILVPRRPGLIELHELGEDLATVMSEVANIADGMQRLYKADKTNIASLGNQVPQLHIHIVMRKKSDAAWAGPVWGVGEPVPYSNDELEKTRKELSALLRAK